MRELARATGADIKSWSDNFPSAGGPRPSRTFLLQVRNPRLFQSLVGFCNLFRPANVQGLSCAAC